MKRRMVVLLAVCALSAGCGGGWPNVVDTRSLFGGGSPSIARVRDVGTREPPESGPMKGEPDGVAAPGELLLIEGSGFGKQPTVTVAGRAAEVVARTAGGGIVVRVPIAVAPGSQPVQVSVGEVHSRVDFPIRRLAVVLHEGALHLLALDGAGAKRIATLPMPGARAVRLSADGACAYVLAGAQKLAVVDLAAPGGPKVVMERQLDVRARTLVASDRAPLIYAVGEGEVQGFNTLHPRTPARYDRAELPPEAKGAKLVELDPEGKRLALAVPEGNRLVLVDLAAHTEAKLIAELKLLPEARVPLVVDLRFAPDGETLWVLSGDNAASLAAGVQPTRVTAVRIEGEPPQVSLWRTAPIAGAGAPLQLLVPRQKPLAAGTTIRMPPEKSAIYFTSAPSALWSAGDAQAVASQFAGHSPGALDQADMGPGAGAHGHLVETTELLGPIDADAGGSVAVAAAGRVTPGGREYGFAVLKPEAGAKVQFTALGPAATADFQPPFKLGEVRVQP